VEDSFKLLEERVGRAADRLQKLRAENEGLRRELLIAKDRTDKAEAAARKAEDVAKAAREAAKTAEQAVQAAAQKAAAADRQAQAVVKPAAAEKEALARAERAELGLATSLAEREELRRRMAKLVETLDKLE
jgi:hypothetical protein